MKKTKMLKKNYEFRQVLSKGIRYSADNLYAYICENNKNYNFLGLAINTKYGKAVKRNRIKRILRENYKILEESIKSGYSFVFLIKKDTNVDLKYKDIKEDMEIIFHKSKIFKEK